MCYGLNTLSKYRSGWCQSVFPGGRPVLRQPQYNRPGSAELRHSWSWIRTSHPEVSYQRESSYLRQNPLQPRLFRYRRQPWDDRSRILCGWPDQMQRKALFVRLQGFSGKIHWIPSLLKIRHIGEWSMAFPNTWWP